MLIMNAPPTFRANVVRPIPATFAFVHVALLVVITRTSVAVAVNSSHNSWCSFTTRFRESTRFLSSSTSVRHHTLPATVLEVAGALLVRFVVRLVDIARVCVLSMRIVVNGTILFVPVVVVGIRICISAVVAAGTAGGVAIVIIYTSGVVLGFVLGEHCTAAR